MQHLALFLVLWLAAAVGHAAIWVHTNNWLHSLKPHGPFMRLLRAATHAINAGGILAFAWTYGPELAGNSHWLSLPPILLAYLACCWLVGLGYVPLMLVRRWTRQPPPHLVREVRSVLDVAQQLGHRPIGQARRSFLARLPSNEIFQVEFSQRELVIPKLPRAWDGLTLLHLTDLHFRGCPSEEFYAAVFEQAASEPADLLLLTGDLVDTDEHYHWLQRLLGKVKWRYGAYAVLGNHDSWYDLALLRKELATLGIRCLESNWQVLKLHGEALVLVGNEMPWVGTLPRLETCPPGFRLLLSHSPDQLPWAKRNNIDLMLAGHNHGGQIQVPGIGPIFVPSRYSGRYHCGVFYEAPTLMVVGRGLSGTTPVRYRCRPEVCRLVLRRHNPSWEAKSPPDE